MNVRLEGSRYVWTAFAPAMVFLFISTIFTPGGLGVGHIILGSVIALAAFLSTAVIWSSDLPEAGLQSRAAEKAKHRNLDAILSRLSDDELEALRERLSERQDDESYVLGDDGELVRRR